MKTTFFPFLLKIFLGVIVISQSYGQLDITPLPNSNLENMSVLLFQDRFGGGDHTTAARTSQGYWEEFANQIGFDLEVTNAAGDMNTSKLNNFDIVVINYTHNVSGWLNASQKQAFENFINNGGHAIGYHTASMPREGQWEWYRHNVIVGLYNEFYHGLQTARMVKTTDAEVLDDPILTGMPDEFSANDEWYAFNQGDFFDEAVVLYYIDESSLSSHNHSNLDAYQMSLPVEERHPLMWYRENSETGSRIFYTGIVHTPAGANTDFFKLTVLRGAEYVAGIKEIPGCPDSNYVEYDPDRTVDDPSLCQTVDVVFPGSTNSTQWLQEGNEIKLYVAEEGDFEGVIRNMSGKVMANFGVKGNSLQRLSTSDLEAGLYVIQIVTPGKTLKRKILLQ